MQRPGLEIRHLVRHANEHSDVRGPVDAEDSLVRLEKEPQPCVVSVPHRLVHFLLAGSGVSLLLAPGRLWYEVSNSAPPVT